VGENSQNAFKISPEGFVTQIVDATGDGGEGELSFPIDLAVDGTGNVYVAGVFSDNLLKVTPAETVTEVIDPSGDGDENPLAVGCCAGSYVAADAAGNAYVTGSALFRFSFDNSCPTAPQPDCEAPIPQKSRIRVVQASSNAKDRAVWTWRGAEVAASDFGDPVTTDDYRLCVYDDVDGLITGAHLPAGGICASQPCWGAKGNPPGTKGHRYKDNEGGSDGVLKLMLQPRGKIVLKSKGIQLLPIGLPRRVPIDLRVQVQAANGECWEAQFSDTGTQANTPLKFKSVSD
jgi:hypothetical protein